MTEPEQKFLDDWSVCFRTRYGDPHPKHWYVFDTQLVPGAEEGSGYLCEGLKERAPRYPAAPVPESRWGVHEAHCCKRHGCTYDSYEKCPVVAGAVDQDHPCDRCSDPMEMSADLVSDVVSELEGTALMNYESVRMLVGRAKEIQRLREAHDD